MSVHIDDVDRVDALMIAGNWLGVDPGSLQHQMRSNRSSSSNAVVYHWTFADQEFMASAEDVQVVRLLAVNES